MTSSDEIKTALSERLEALCALGHVERDGIALVTRNRHLTSLISDAVERAGNETYGLCAECEQRISPERLAALPWARYCIICQEMKEGFAADVRWNNAA
jgi:hypothetical protein